MCSMRIWIKLRTFFSHWISQWWILECSKYMMFYLFKTYLYHFECNAAFSFSCETMYGRCNAISNLSAAVTEGYNVIDIHIILQVTYCTRACPTLYIITQDLRSRLRTAGSRDLLNSSYLWKFPVKVCFTPESSLHYAAHDSSSLSTKSHFHTTVAYDGKRPGNQLSKF